MGCGTLARSLRSVGERHESKTLLLNCSIPNETFTPTYRKPFDLIVEGLQTEEWGPTPDASATS